MSGAQLTTPEMLSYLVEEITDNASRGRQAASRTAVKARTTQPAGDTPQPAGEKAPK